jgi:putative endonuclease
MEEHRSAALQGFAARYKAHKLVYYEIFSDPANAIVREKQIKGGSRQSKMDLVRQMNPSWRDLTDDI